MLSALVGNSTSRQLLYVSHVADVAGFGSINIGVSRLIPISHEQSCTLLVYPARTG